MKEKLIRRNASRTMAACVCVFILLLLLFCNLRTDLVADDFRYFFSYADESRIESIGQIFPSMAAHRHSMNGRVVAHFLVQLSLLLPLWIFKAINSAVFLGLMWLIYRMDAGRKEHNALLLLCIFFLTWILQPEFGQVFLWQTGAINYLWCALLSLVFIRPYVNYLLYGGEMKKPRQILFIIFALFVGAYSENSSVALIFMAMLAMAPCRFVFKEKLPTWMYLALIAAFLGFMYMMLAPAESVNKSAEFSLPVLLSNFGETFMFYLRFWPLLIAYALLYYLAVKNAASLRLRLASLMLLGGSLAGHFVLTFAMYCAGRSTYIGLTLLLTAAALLFPTAFEGKGRRLMTALCALCLCLGLYKVYFGVRDIQRTHYLLGFNEQLIQEAVAAGDSLVQVPRPYARTKYSALEGLAYLSTEDPDYWANRYMAMYYGAEGMIGY